MPADTKSTTLQEAKPSLRVTSGTPCGGDSRQRNEFVNVGAQTLRKSLFFMKFRHLTRATGATMQTLPPLKLFLYPMDRAEVLHAQSYNISGRRKNTLDENELVLSCEIFDFPKFPLT